MSAEAADAYADWRHRCLTIGRSLDDATAALTVPCCPAWSVRDLFAHLAGVPDDILAGRLDGVTTDAWTAAQLDRRIGVGMAALCDELEEKGSAVEAILRGGAVFPPPFFIDAWTHEWDLRQALDLPAVPDLRLLEPAIGPLVAGMESRADAVGGRLVVTVDGAVEDAGPSELDDGCTLDVDRFELARIAMGRRSLAQLEALPWRGRRTFSAEVLVAFSPATIDIVDPVDLGGPATR